MWPNLPIFYFMFCTSYVLRKLSLPQGHKHLILFCFLKFLQLYLLHQVFNSSGNYLYVQLEVRVQFHFCNYEYPIIPAPFAKGSIILQCFFVDLGLGSLFKFIILLSLDQYHTILIIMTINFNIWMTSPLSSSSRVYWLFLILCSCIIF